MNRKLKLDVDALSVRSFDTGRSEQAGRGTVHAREAQKRPCYTFLDPSCLPATYHTCASFDFC